MMEFAELIFLSIGTFFDVRDQVLPAGLLWLFGIIAAAGNFIFSYQSIQSVLIGACIGCVFLLVGWITKEAIGYGDGFGLVILGIFEGWRGVIPIIIGAFLLSAVYGTWRLFLYRESRTETMPFYPFLLIAFWGVLIL